MRTAKLTRLETSAEGTFGRLVTDSGYACWVLELPSPRCVPAGEYACERRQSSHHGLCYHVDGVLGRTGIEIHPANWAGDTEAGWYSQLLGCLAPGDEVAHMLAPNGKMQKAVTHSARTLAALEADLAGEPFRLEIEEA